MDLDFVIIGGMKCGSTAIGTYFSRHPQVNFCEIIETNYFSRGAGETIDLDQYFKIYYRAGKGIKGESSPTYSHPRNLSYTPKVLKNNFPKLKIILVVRNPFDRILSHINHLKLNGENIPSRMSDCMKIYPNLIENSRFGLIVKEYLNVFGTENLLVVKFEDILAGKGLEDICCYLNLPLYSDILPVANKTDERYIELPIIKFYKKHWTLFRKIPLLKYYKKPLKDILEKAFSERIELEKDFLSKQNKQLIHNALHDDVILFEKHCGYSPFDLKA